MRVSFPIALMLVTLAFAGCAQEEVATTDTAPIEDDLDMIAEQADEGPSASDDAQDVRSKEEGSNRTDEQELEEGRAFEPVRDIILEQVYTAAGAPEPTGSVFPASFDLAEGYQTLELVGTVECTGEDNVRFVDYLDIKVTAPDGTKTTEFMSLGQGVIGLAVGEMSSCGNTFPIHYGWDPMPGTYTLEVTALTPTSVTLWVVASSGLAPDFQYRLLDSEEIGRLSDHVGQVTLIDIMATWCGPCNEAMPDLVTLKEDYGELLQILSIDVDTTETDDELRDFKDKHEATWVFGFDHNETLRGTYHTGWMPSFAVVDQTGGLLYRQIGAFDPAKAREIIDYALENR